MNVKTLFLKLLQLLPVVLVICLTAVLIKQENQDPSEIQDSTGLPMEENFSVSFSVPGGFYDGDFSLELWGPEGFTIYYTLDGSEPDEAAAVYTQPLSITNVSSEKNIYANRSDFNPNGESVMGRNKDKAVVIRAVGIDAFDVRTQVVTASYFVGYDASKYEGYHILSIVSDPDGLFDSEDGMYVLGKAYASFVASGGDPNNDNLANYNQTGSFWERPAHIDYFDSSQNHIFSQEAGMRINGSSSRSSGRKSLRLYARKKYDGNSRFIYSFFEDNLFEKSIILRRGEFANQFLPSLVSDRDVSIQEYLPCAVFLDGEFWGYYYLLERYSSEYMETHYYVDERNVTLLKDGDLFDGSGEIYLSYQDLLEYIKNTDLSITKNYEYVCSQIDMQSYIDYYCTQIYLNNYDFHENKNTLIWRSNEIDAVNPYADNRWRWVLIDLDYTLTGYGGNENYATNTFEDRSASSIAVQIEEPLFRAFLNNPDFRMQFVTTFLDLQNANFDYETVAAAIEEHSHFVSNPDIWKEFFEKRPDYINRYLADAFSLTGELTEVTLETESAAGTICLNTITPDISSGIWTGSYFSDYPITVNAVTNPGYRFKHWVVNGEIRRSSETTVSLTEDPVTIRAVFEAE